MKMTVYAESEGFMLIGVDNPGVVKSQWQKATHRAAVATINWWIEDRLPLHFGRSNWHRYRETFFKRKATTMKRKAKKFGHTIALVNHPIHQPPAHRASLERFMALTLPVMTRRPGGGAAATWSTPGITGAYKEETVAINAEDEELQLRRFHHELMGQIAAGRAPLRRKVKRSMTRSGWKSLKRYKRVKIV
jgi:hypothetical protein